MAGHSKWANIKHRKSAQDAKRGKIFMRLIREITIAARTGASPEDNPRLRGAIAKAQAANMTKDTIDRAIAKSAGTGENNNLEEITYEGYGPGGVAIMIETMTDNRNRTVAEIRHALTKHGGNMGANGCVAYLFIRIGEVRVDDTHDEEQLLSLILDTGAEDFSREEAPEGRQFVIRTAPDSIGKLCEALLWQNIQPITAETRMQPTTEIDLDENQALKLLKLLDMLEELDDTQNVYHNAGLSDSVLKALNNATN